MSKLSERASAYLRTQWGMEVLVSLVDDGITVEDLRDMIQLGTENKEAISNALAYRRHGKEYCSQELLRNLASSPLLSDEEKSKLEEKEPPRERDTRWWGRKGFIYLMRNTRNGFIKIGFSKTPQNREKTLQSEEPEIELIFTREGTAKDEVDLHQKYKEMRLRGEWFALSPAHILEITGGASNV